MAYEFEGKYQLNELAPIVLFVYNRLHHTRETVQALIRNDLSAQSRLFIFSDGAKDDSSKESVEAVRKYINTIKDFHSISVTYRSKNIGIADNIINGVSEIVSSYGKVIVLEDDIVTSKYFLKYMNDALDKYDKCEKVMHVSGYMFPIFWHRLPQTVFYRSSSCWGWATWARAWKYFKRDPEYIMNHFTPSLVNYYNIDGAINFWQQIEQNKSGLIRTWSAFWSANIILNKGLCLHPARSLVRNIGHDSSGMNCGSSSIYNVALNDKTIKYFENDITESELLLKRIRKYFNVFNNPGLYIRAYNRIRSLYTNAINAISNK